MKTLKLSSRFDPAIWVVVAVGLTALGFMTHNHFRLQHIFSEYDILSTYAGKAEVDLITGHLRLEEYMTGIVNIVIDERGNEVGSDTSEPSHMENRDAAVTTS